MADHPQRESHSPGATEKGRASTAAIAEVARILRSRWDRRDPRPADVPHREQLRPGDRDQAA